MEHGQSSVEKFEKFTWKVENFSRLETDEIWSEPFVLGGYAWRITLYPKGNKIYNHLSIYLDAVQMQTADANMSNGWSRDVKFNFVVFNQLDSYMNKTITDESNYKFNASAESGGYQSFMTLDELHDPYNGFIVEDVCIVGVEVFVCQSTDDKPVNQAADLTASLTFGRQTSHVEVPRPNPEVPISNIETISPVSTLVCSEPSKQADTELVSASLGRVLYFLKTRKVKDMDGLACKELQILWDELKKFKFDLSWLEPHVQSALGMKSFVDKAMQVEKLRGNVVVQELETERLKTKLVAAEVNLDTERNLLKAKGLNEIDLDSELGRGSWRP